MTPFLVYGMDTPCCMNYMGVETIRFHAYALWINAPYQTTLLWAAQPLVATLRWPSGRTDGADGPGVQEHPLSCKG